ncbi:hypothetical protein BGZ94_001544 [Podila epigama]|nr:hypothetical protein BGZ94_001544 [Podila epigama]
MAGDMAKEVIQIGYIPRTQSNTSLPLADLTAPQATFMKLTDESHNKHDSLASTVSTGTLDQAILMAVRTKATPQLIRLNTIKASNSDLIQRSNSLHSSNSIKRTKSQKRLAEAKKLVKKNSKPSLSFGPSQEGSDLRTNVTINAMKQDNEAERTDGSGQDHEQNQNQNQNLKQNTSQIHAYDLKQELEEDDGQGEDQDENQWEYTPAVMLTGPSARSSAQSSISIGQRKPKTPTMVLEPQPIYHQKLQQGQGQFPTSNPFQPAGTVTGSVNPPSMIPAVSGPVAPRISFEPSDPFSMEGQDGYSLDKNPHSLETLRPWTSGQGIGGVAGSRDSTFSMTSDARSLSTRADGEEIMIFWDGHRDSRVSLSS